MSLHFWQHTPTGKVHVYPHPDTPFALCHRTHADYVEDRHVGWPKRVTRPSTALCEGCERRATKACSTCEVVQPLTNFHLRGDTVDGRQTHCKDCRRAYRISRGKSGVRRAARTDATEMLYVRIPEATKDRLARYAEARNDSLARSTDALLTLALNMVERELAKQGRALPEEDAR